MSLSPYAERSETLSAVYRTLEELARAIDGPYFLRECDGTMSFPGRGVYFFFSLGTDFDGPPSQWRLTRIGTVGVASGSQSTLWNRLRQHRGNVSGKYAQHGGNHRGSISEFQQFDFYKSK
ncbi:hypothetical protein SAMN05216388_10332 [Halorientalis persicus]|uniref:GIY-YIG domain-containing protein n=1 Tax=Halorientalis persicus TaxID=1367881 RepID=A0A1H8V3Q9_9EURY|nr:hypothetical protein [Halorientalis persicus]SEP10031.1 hypothetical protein SAMN05216388_10332 [Halorientalis persicus]